MELCTNLGYTKSIQVNTDMFKDCVHKYIPSNKNYPNDYFQKTSTSFIFDTSISLPNNIFSDYTLYYGRTLHYGTIIYNKYLYMLLELHMCLFIFILLDLHQPPPQRWKELGLRNHCLLLWPQIVPHQLQPRKRHFPSNQQAKVQLLFVLSISMYSTLICTATSRLPEILF